MRCDATIRQPGRTEDPARPTSVELRLVFPCAPSNVRAALASTMSGLAAMDLSEDDSSTVELVLAEVLNNVSEHAYGDDAEGRIELHLSQTASGLSCRVLDDGAAMPRSTPPCGTPPAVQRLLALQPEGGFGWFLIRKLTTDLAYLREANRNILSFRIDVRHALRHN